jgi:hypothetical protein
MWQMGGLGPMAGQTHHFRQYAPAIIADQRQIAYGAIRYTNETHRLWRARKAARGAMISSAANCPSPTSRLAVGCAVEKPGHYFGRVSEPEGMVRACRRSAKASRRASSSGPNCGPRALPYQENRRKRPERRSLDSGRVNSLYMAFTPSNTVKNSCIRVNS